MANIEIKVASGKMTVVESEPLIDKSAGDVTFTLECDSAWDGFNKVLIFSNGVDRVERLPSESDVVPWEVLRHSGILRISLTGENDSHIKRAVHLSTGIKVVSGGHYPGLDPQERSKEAWEQCLEQQAEYTEQCKDYADQAASAIDNATYINFDIDEDGYLIENVTGDADDLEFALADDGQLEVTYL